MAQRKFVIASVHERNAQVAEHLSNRFPSFEFVLISTREKFTSQNLASIDPEYVFIPHWSWIIPMDIYSHFACVIFHMTDLPYGRGGSPLQNLIVRGHKETKISALKCVSDVDAGPIFLKRPLSLEGSAEVILRRASSIIEEMIAYIIVERPEPTPQVGEITKFSRRGPKDGDIEKCQSIEEVYDYIRMLDAVGYPSAFLDAERLRLEFSQAKLKEDYVEAVVRIRRKQHAS